MLYNMTFFIRIPILFTLIMFVPFPCISQHSFELSFGETNSNNNIACSFEYQDAYYVAGNKGVSEGSLISCAVVYKISKSGEILAQAAFPKVDSNYALNFGFPKQNGNLQFMGTLAADADYPNFPSFTYLCELTPDLEMVWEKIDTIPTLAFNINKHYLVNYLITSEEEIIIQGKIDTVAYGTNDILFLSKYDMQGNRIYFNIYSQWKDYGVSSELIFNTDSTGFYLIGSLSLNYVFKSWIEFNLDLEMLGSGTLTDENSLLSSPINVVRLDNSNIFIANNLAEFDNWYNYGVELRLYNPELELIKTAIYYTQQKVYTPLKQGIGHVNDNYIWVAAFEEVPATGIPGSEDIILLVFDSELNLLGEKVHHGDTRFWIYNLMSCSDMGCLITGIVPEYGGADWPDNYLLKVELDDVITSTIDHFNPKQRIAIHPVPIKDMITLKDVPESSVLLFYTPTGRQVASFRLEEGENQFEIGYLPAGIYYVSILQNQQFIQTSKIIKQ